MILEETMERKPDRITDRLAVLSLWLGILAVITSFPFWLVLIILFPGYSCEGFSIFCWLYDGGGVWILSLTSLILGTVGLVTRIISIRMAKEKRGSAVKGIIFNSIVFLVAVVVMILLYGG
jgi:phosphatidylglycerophosphate synthase